MVVLFCAAVGGTILLFLLERIIHALCVVSWHVVHGTESDIKTFAAFGVVSSVFSAWCNLVLSIGAVSTTVLGSLVNAGRWILQIVLIGLICTLIVEYYPRFVEDTIHFWNDGFGAGLRALIYETAHLFYLLFSVLLPLYNASIYIVSKILSVIIIPGLQVDFHSFLLFLGSFWNFFLHVLQSFTQYILVFDNCNIANSTTACFEPGLRMLDVITPMGDVRLMAGHAVNIFNSNCNILAPALDLALYPLMDINLAKAVHSLVNSVLLTVFHIPIITYERCKASSGDSGPLSVLMCVPDFDPAWNSFFSGMRFLGRCIDNWLNIIAVILEEVITTNSPTCTAAPLAQDVSAPSTELFGVNETITVGLTPGMYATTDGWSTQYTLFTQATKRLLVTHAWPMKVDVGLGIAAVRYTDESERDLHGYTTTAMLGCRCDDVEGRLSITCAISPYGVEEYDTLHLRWSDYVMPVSFQLPSTAEYMTCLMVHISVQSVRWPLSRVARPDFNGVLRNVKDPLQTGDANEEPRELDAVIYVTPRCSDSLQVDLDCIDSFRRVACYPYCLAGRMTGSMNSALVLYDSDDWEANVQLLKRDCGLGTITVTDDFQTGGFAYSRDSDTRKYSSRYDMQWNDVGGTTVTTESVPGDSSRGACTYNVNVATRTKRSLLPAYSELGSVRLGEQPFVVAGDASLFVEWDDQGDDDIFNDVAFVRVKRLFGSEVSQFTLLTMDTKIPTVGVCQSMDTCLEAKLEPSKITVPRAYSRSPANAAPAVATKWSVLFAVNPSPDIYAAFFMFCKDQVNVGLQFEITSAYGPIRIWRIDAFVDDASLKTQLDRQDISLTIDSFDQNITAGACAIPVNMSVTSMTYLNEYNIAVTVLRASPRYFDIETGLPRPGSPPGTGNVSFDVYYLNPRTMKLRTNELWEEEPAVSTLAQGYLCPNMRRLPLFGSFFAEIALIFASSVRFPMTIIVNIPALIPGNLRYIRECPFVTRGHTMLRECGVNILSLEYYFESVNRANSFFWAGFSDIGAAFQNIPVVGQQTRTFMNGVAVTGNNGFFVVPQIPWIQYPATALVWALPSSIRVFFRLKGLARILYEFMSQVFIELLSFDEYNNFGALVNLLWSKLYDLRMRYDELVTTPAVNMCTGLAIAMGWSNPFAQLARDFCLVGVNVVPSMLNIANVLFVHYPVLKCMCDMDNGVAVQKQAAQKCFAAAPLQYKPVIAEVISRGTGQVKGMCIEMSKFANQQLKDAPAALFDNADRFAEDISGSIQYLVSIFVGDSACTNFYTSPYVMTLMPYPIDYFRSCGNTDLCRSRCQALFEAFEFSLATGGVRPDEKRSVIVQKSLALESDILNRRNLIPFNVLAVLEHPTCNIICGDAAGKTARCFSVTGIDSNEYLAVALYCVPHAADIGLTEIIRWRVPESSTWATQIIDVKFLNTHEPNSIGGPYDPVVVLRRDGIIICGTDGIIQKVLDVTEIDPVYVSSPRNMRDVKHFYVVPAAANSFAKVVIHGKTERLSLLNGKSIITEDICATININLALLTPIFGVSFLSMCDEGHNLPLLVGDSHMSFTPNINKAAIIPIDNNANLKFCDFSVTNMAVGNCKEMPGDAALYSAASTLRTLGETIPMMFMMTKQGITIQRNDIASQTTTYPLQTDAGVVYSIFKSDHSGSTVLWLSNIQVIDSTTALTMQSLYSVPMELSVTIQHSCNVMSCTGCAAASTQKLCYAAQQCAISKCVGTTVNMQLPACMLGMFLKESTELFISKYRMIWNVLYELLHMLVDLSTGQLQKNIKITFPYDIVDTVMCETKDVIVTFFAVLMTTVNSIILTLTRTVPDEFYKARNQLKAQSTLLLASITNFFSHLAYAYLYTFFAAIQMNACLSNSVLAVFDVVGTSVRILPTNEEGWDHVGGMCMTKMAGESLNEFGAGSSGKTDFLNVVGDMFESMSKAFAGAQFEPVIHPLDAGITWAVGVFKSVQDIMQVADTAHCKMPDMTMKHIVQCACGDSAVRIPDSAAQAGLQDAAFWCTGALSMVLSDGTQRIVFNPYTLQTLRDIVEPTIEQYLECISGGYKTGEYNSCHSLEPRDSYLDRQGVSVLQVYTRCRSNYVARQWDEAAALLFDPTRSPDLLSKTAFIMSRFNPSRDIDIAVTNCMLESLDEGLANDRCLDTYLQIANIKKGEYFAYEDTSGMFTVDACEVFSGPASNKQPDFVACMDETGIIDTTPVRGADTSTACELPYFLWSGRSRNRIPVASPHLKVSSGENTDRFAVAENIISTSILKVRLAIEQYLREWTGDELKVSLFTSEGDSLHQALDCMIMGPYAAADLWPGDGASFLLPSARYSRQSTINDRTMLSREFELPCTGDRLRGDNYPPFTCGSTARRATMKYFVRDFMTAGKNDSLKQIVIKETREYFADLLSKWENINNYGCPCATGGNALECCSELDTAGWVAFLDSNARKKRIAGSQLTENLLNDMAEFARSALVKDTKEVLTRYADEEQDYTWTLEEALIAVDLGLYNALEPVIFYDASEAGSPFKGNASLFDVCIAHISSVMFTQPLQQGTWAATDEPFHPTSGDLNGFMSAIEAYVSRVTERAASHVPSYWHNVLRHVPSDSAVCLDQVQDGTIGVMPLDLINTDARFTNNTNYGYIRNNLGEMQNKVAKNAGTDTQNIAAKNFDALFAFVGWQPNSLSALNDKCVCGWREDTRCYIPEEVCNQVSKLRVIDTRFDSLNTLCVQDITEDGKKRAYYTATEQWWQVHVAVASSAVQCDDMQPSDAWGLVEQSWSREWARGQVTSPKLSVYSLLTEGRSGVRLGNMQQISAKWNSVIGHTKRLRPLVHPSDPKSTAGQRICKRSVQAEVFKADLLNRYVDEFFPVSQGIRGSLAVESCTRYMIELARVQVLLAAGLKATNKEQMQTWRRRCVSQLNIIDMCNVYGVFDVTPKVRVEGGCAFTVSNLPATAYVTRSCLVYTDKRFHDPCRCTVCDGTAIPFQTVRLCPLPVDVRSLVKRAGWGGMFHWAQNFPKYMNESTQLSLRTAMNALLSRYEEAATPLALQVDAFTAAVVNKTNIFNTNGKWATAEGISGETDASLFCDSVIDWWPEDWSDPVGYHVTTQPFADETGYRVFDNAFVVDRGNDVYIVYEHSYLRNHTLSQNNFGASGMCGSHSYGMPMAELNTMRVCTNTSTDDLADPDVPLSSTRRENTGDDSEWFPEYCASTPAVPWTNDADYDTQTSAGLVSHWGRININNWPELGTVLPEIRPVESQEFGDSCFLPGQITCVEDEDCDKLAVSTATAKMKCYSGICAVREQYSRSFQCSMHAHCANGKLCSGFGTCITPVIMWTNDLPEAIEAQMYSSDCGTANAESMVGASQWERADNLLHDAGFCSYRSWFEYKDMVNRSKCTNSPCAVNSDQVGVRNTATNAATTQGTIWDQHRFRLSPHACDRDYQHIEGFKTCTITQSVSGVNFKPAKMMRTFNEDRSLWLHTGTDYHRAMFGFLGRNETFDQLYDKTSDKSNLKFCLDIAQCHLQPVTMNGLELVQRKAINIEALKTNNATRYNEYFNVGYRDVFKCGSFGLYMGVDSSNNEKCILDPAVTQLWHIICYKQQDQITEACPWSDEWFGDSATFQRKFCSVPGGDPVNVLPYYSAKYATAIAAYLNWLTASAFKTQPTTFSAYRRLMTCAERIWEHYATYDRLQHPYVFAWTAEGVQVKQKPQWLYHYDGVFPHALTEFPFAWWVKCTLLSGIMPTQNSFVPCQAWEKRTSNMDTDDIVVTFLQRFDGVITDDWWKSNVNSGQTPIPSSVCSSSSPARSYYNEQMLLALLSNVRSSIAARKGITDSFDETCYGSRDFDTEAYTNNDLFMMAVYAFYNNGNDAVGTYTTPKDPSTKSTNPYLSRVWTDLCAHWFLEPDWFTVLDDTQIMRERVVPGKGVPVGYFTSLFSDRLDKLVKQLQLTYSPGTCRPLYTLNSNLEQFCIFEGNPPADPLVAASYETSDKRPHIMLQENKDNADSMWTLQSFEKSGYDSKGTQFVDVCDSEPFVFTINPTRKDYYNYGNGNWFDQEAYYTRNMVQDLNPVGAPKLVLMDSYDMFGQACNLRIQSNTDTCWQPWVEQYRTLTGNKQLTCQNPQRNSLATQYDFTAQSILMENPARDVCWPRNSTCLDARLGRAKVIHFPPGVTYWLYKNEAQDTGVADTYLYKFLFGLHGPTNKYETVFAPYAPAWQFCPRGDLPKSSFVGNTIWKASFKSPTVFATNADTSTPLRESQLEIDTNIWSMRLRLQNNVACCIKSESDCSGLCRGIGQVNRIPIEIRRNMFACVDCTRANRKYCSGKHDCKYRAPTGLTTQEREQLDFWNIPASGFLSHQQLVWAIHLISKQVIEDTDTHFFVEPETSSGFFTAEGLDAFANFDSTGAREYDNSLSAGQSEDVRECATIGNTDQVVDYSQCSNDEFLKSFAAFVDTNYRRQTGIVIPGKSSVMYNSDARQLLGINIPAYAKHERIYGEVFAAWLLDLPARCKDTTIYTAICVQLQDSFKVLNPWSGGDFNPTEFCDTPIDAEENVRMVDVFCNKAVCPNYYNGHAELDLFYQGVPESCLNQRRAIQRMPRRSSSYNLCAQKPPDTEQCQHKQGVLGGMLDSSGIAVDGNTIEDLYSEVPRSSLQTVGGLFYPARNRLFEGRLKYEVGYGRITPIGLKPEDICGHGLHFAVDSSGSLRIVDVMLGQTYDRPNASLGWLQAYESLINAEAVSENTEGGMSWDCPFLRLKYWGRQDPALRAPTPNAFRAKVMFSALNSNKAAHPLMAPSQPVAIVRYATSNGYCMCVTNDKCVFPLANTEDCGLRKTIYSMYSEEWVNTVALYRGTGLCYDQTDWPYINGTLRDGSNLPGNRFSQNCSIFDRLPAFQYRVKNVEFTATPKTSTSADGGDCHMGRAAKRSTVESKRCRLHNKTADTMTLLCEDGTKPVVQREKSLAPDWVVSHATKTRRKCTGANKMPTFKTSDGASMPAASSFGLHTRISAERFLASDLYRIICSSVNCSTALAKDRWKTGEFLATVLTDPTKLFLSTNYTPVRLQEESVSDAVLWQDKWVACVRDEADGLLLNCSGHIGKEEWSNPDTRMPACIREVAENSDTNLAMDLTLCDLDGQTDTLCTVLSQAEHDIQEAHCIAAGACLRETFYYHPATYSTTNEEFVRKTVEEFYLSVSAKACPEAALERAEMLSELKLIEEECSAVFLTPLIEMLEQVREILHIVMRILYYTAMIILNMFRLLVDPLHFSDIVDNIIYYFLQLMEEVLVIIKAAGELMWTAIKNSPIGKAIEQMIKKTCQLILILVTFVRDILCHYTAEFILKIKELLLKIKYVEIGNWKPFSSAIPDGAIEDLVKAENKIRNCVNPSSIVCDTDQKDKTGSSQPKPSATRCWTQYITTLGDAGPLSCTGADTCVSGISEELQLCYTCPSAPEGINEFGCDPVRKVCACGVLQIERTPCVNHLQCSMQSDATCVFLDSDYEVTFGTTGCAQCSDTPICIKAAGQTTGVCSCPLTRTEEESCEEVGEAVFPSATGLCLTAVGSTATVLSQDTTFNAEYSRMLSVPCRAADITQTFCFNVQYDAFTAVPRIVVLDTLVFSDPSGPFRRLLSARDWGKGVCALIAESEYLSATEKAHLAQCNKWYMVAEHLIAEYNLSNVQPHFLLSAADFADAVTDFRAMEDLISKPMWLIVAFAHSDYAKPVMSFVTVVEHWLWSIWRSVEHAGLIVEDTSMQNNMQNNTNHTETWANFTLAHQSLFATSALYVPPLPVSRRVLLQWRDDLSAVQQYSLQVTLSGEATQKLSVEAAKVWLTGPTRWPPDFSYWGDSSCVSGKLLKEIMVYSLNTTIQYYLKTGPPRMTPAASFKDSMLKIPAVYNEDMLPLRANVSKADFLSQAFLKLRNFLESLGLTRAAAYNLFAAIPETVNKFFTCDLEKVMFCTHYRRTVWYSFWWVLLYACVILVLIQFSQLPFQTVLLVSTITILTLFYSLEYSIMCVPMVPSCVLDEWIETLSILIPTKLHWPNALQIYPGCISGDTSMRPANVSADATCIVSCSDTPHEYTRWEAPLAWWVCDFDQRACRRLAAWLADRNLAQALQRYLLQKAELIDMQDKDTVYAQRICATLTAWYILPWLVLATALLYMLTWGTVIPFLVAQSAVQTAVQAIQMSHVAGRSLKRHTNMFVNRAMRQRLQ